MVNGPTLVTQLNINVLGIAGYYTEQDRTQHVIVASTSGDVSEVHWSPSPSPATVTRMANYGTHLAAIGGFCSPRPPLDDGFQHAIPATADPATAEGTLRELYFQSPQAPQVRDPLSLVHSFAPAKGLAGFSSPSDGEPFDHPFDQPLRHVVVVNQSGNLLLITWDAHHQPTIKQIVIPPTVDQIASISGFLASERHIIVARSDNGDIYDIHFPNLHRVPPFVDQHAVLISFKESVRNVTAFFNSDTNYRHVVVLTDTNLLRDHAYNTVGSYDTVGSQSDTLLTQSPLSNVADITSYYTAYDHLRHVIFATYDGDLFEITYGSQGEQI
jgi:hypothetical protein